MTSKEKDIEREFQHSSVKGHLDLALENAHNDEPEKAMAECELARQAMPEIAIAYNYFGMVLEELNQVEPAIDAYLKAIQLNPRFYAARENLSNARLRLEEEQYRQVAVQSGNEAQEEYEMGPGSNESEVLENLENVPPVPGWVYLDEKGYLLTGWPGHRTRPGRSGYDPLETDFELAHIEGIIIRLLITRKLRTHNPIYLLFMTGAGLLFSLPILIFLLDILQGNWDSILVIIVSSPFWIVGIALLVNVFLSLRLKKTDGFSENDYPFL